MASAVMLSLQTAALSSGRICRAPGAVQRASLAIRPVSIRHVRVRTMATQGSGVKLDKSTPENKWKEILGAEEVRHMLLVSLRGPDLDDISMYSEAASYV
jgi:hypothetical protein